MSEIPHPGTPQADSRIRLETRYLLVVLTWLALVLLAGTGTWWAAHALRAAFTVQD